jgi:hypothetical protein
MEMELASRSSPDWSPSWERAEERIDEIERCHVDAEAHAPGVECGIVLVPVDRAGPAARLAVDAARSACPAALAACVEDALAGVIEPGSVEPASLRLYLAAEPPFDPRVRGQD